MDDQLTGRTRHRITRWKRKCILQVQVVNTEWVLTRDVDGPTGDVFPSVRWRDATPEDLQRPEINE